MAAPKLKIVTRTQGNNAALKDGTVVPADFVFDFEEVPVLVHAFRRMVRELEFDVCEMALTTYLCAREHGVRFTALPIFLVRAFHHGAIVHNPEFAIQDPKGLEGKRVGVNRGYTVTTGVWARAILQEEYGVDLSKVTWVLSGDEHVEDYVAPPNVVPIGALISAGKSGKVARSLPISAVDWVNCVPTSCMPSPESPANRITTSATDLRPPPVGLVSARLVAIVFELDLLSQVRTNGFMVAPGQKSSRAPPPSPAPPV